MQQAGKPATDLREDKDLLRFITCGSVDDGKSTLIGRLLYDSRSLLDDQVEALGSDTKRLGGKEEEPDLSLLMDGLEAERQQGITIDVAYRFFETEKRKFIIGDCPGHEQYTRNMVTGASTAQLALILIDARKGISRQTARHAFIAHMMGLRHMVLAVNKMDLVDYSKSRWEEILSAFGDAAQKIGIGEFTAIPVSGLRGDNVVSRSAAMDWYPGPTLIEYLETVPAGETEESATFSMPVQWVNRPNQDFRGYCGTIATGEVRPGKTVRVLPAGQAATVGRIVTQDGDLTVAVRNDSVTLTLLEDVDCSRGDVIASEDHEIAVADQMEAMLVWMDGEELLPGRVYRLKIGTASTNARVTTIKHSFNMETLEQIPARTLGLNGIAVVNLALDQPLPFTSYAANRSLGGFILIDRHSNATSGAGMINFPLRRAQNIQWQELEVDRRARAEIMRQKPRILWFTGLSAAGKSTIANLVEKKLHDMGRHTFLLDGDNLRHGLNRDLGFTDADRVENIRRAGEVAKLMVDAGLIVLCAFISPFRAERQMVRAMFGEEEFLEIFVDIDLDEAERRDPKGLYAAARAGRIPNFTGINSPYERPQQAEIHIDSGTLPPEEAAKLIVEYLLTNGVSDLS